MKLPLRASQWVQVSSALAQLDLDNLQELTIVYVVDLVLPFRNYTELGAHLAQRADDEPDEAVLLPPLGGSNVQLGCLSTLHLRASHDYPDAGIYLPMRVPADTVSAIISTLGITTRLSTIQLHNIIPSLSMRKNCCTSTREHCC